MTTLDSCHLFYHARQLPNFNTDHFKSSPLTNMDSLKDIDTEESQTHVATAESQDKGPVPMSFPATLRTTGLTDRYAHLLLAAARSSTLASHSSFAVPKKNRRDEKEGKRWVRRKENGTLPSLVH